MYSAFVKFLISLSDPKQITSSQPNRLYFYLYSSLFASYTHV